LEFGILLPLVLFITVFAIDLGRLIWLGAAVQDAAYQSAQTGAQVGGACLPTGNCDQSSLARQSYNQAISAIPGAASPSTISWHPTTGQVCTSTGSNSNVTIVAGYPMTFLTPGLDTIMKVIVGPNPQIVAMGVARCEVVGP